jgi:hypothetical protein
MGLYVRLKDRVIELTHSKFAVPMLDITDDWQHAVCPKEGWDS